jgi:Reverse transcriptase (RNA-dependent DNA polymerase)
MIFSLRKLQEKCRKLWQPLYIAFIDLTKAFDLVSRSGLFAMLEKIGCPQKLLKMVISFHNDMQGSAQFYNSVWKYQGCTLAPSLFGIFFSVLHNHAFGSSNEGIYIHIWLDGKLFNLARLKAKIKVRKVLIREMLYNEDAALTAQSQVQLPKYPPLTPRELRHHCRKDPKPPAGENARGYRFQRVSLRNWTVQLPQKLQQTAIQNLNGGASIVSRDTGAID